MSTLSPAPIPDYKFVTNNEYTTSVQTQTQTQTPTQTPTQSNSGLSWNRCRYIVLWMLHSMMKQEAMGPDYGKGPKTDLERAKYAAAMRDFKRTRMIYIDQQEKISPQYTVNATMPESLARGVRMFIFDMDPILYFNSQTSLSEMINGSIPNFTRESPPKLLMPILTVSFPKPADYVAKTMKTIFQSTMNRLQPDVEISGLLTFFDSLITSASNIINTDANNLFFNKEVYVTLHDFIFKNVFLDVSVRSGTGLVRVPPDTMVQVVLEYNNALGKEYVYDNQVPVNYNLFFCLFTFAYSITEWKYITLTAMTCMIRWIPEVVSVMGPLQTYTYKFFEDLAKQHPEYINARMSRDVFVKACTKLSLEYNPIPQNSQLQKILDNIDVDRMASLQVYMSWDLLYSVCSILAPIKQKSPLPTYEFSTNGLRNIVDSYVKTINENVVPKVSAAKDALARYISDTTNFINELETTLRVGDTARRDELLKPAPVTTTVTTDGWNGILAALAVPLTSDRQFYNILNLVVQQCIAEGRENLWDASLEGFIGGLIDREMFESFDQDQLSYGDNPLQENYIDANSVLDAIVAELAAEKVLNEFFNTSKLADIISTMSIDTKTQIIDALKNIQYDRSSAEAPPPAVKDLKAELKKLASTVIPIVAEVTTAWVIWVVVGGCVVLLIGVIILAVLLK